MKSNIVKLERSDDLILKLPEGWAKEGEKVSIRESNGNVIIEKLVDLEIDMDDDMFLEVAKLAHKQDITFNEMIAKILEKQLKDCEYESC